MNNLKYLNFFEFLYTNHNKVVFRFTFVCSCPCLLLNIYTNPIHVMNQYNNVINVNNQFPSNFILFSFSIDLSFYTEFYGIL